MPCKAKVITNYQKWFASEGRFRLELDPDDRKSTNLGNGNLNRALDNVKEELRRRHQDKSTTRKGRQVNSNIRSDVLRIVKEVSTSPNCLCVNGGFMTMNCCCIGEMNTYTSLD